MMFCAVFLRAIILLPFFVFPVVAAGALPGATASWADLKDSAKAERNALVIYHVGRSPERAKAALQNTADLFAEAFKNTPGLKIGQVSERPDVGSVGAVGDTASFLFPNLHQQGGVFYVLTAWSGEILQTGLVDRGMITETAAQLKSGVEKFQKLEKSRVSFKDEPSAERLKQFDEALSSFPPDVVITQFAAMTKEIVASDKDEKLGYCAKYKKLERTVNVDLVLPRLLFLLDIRLKPALEEGDAEAVLLGVEQFVQQEKLTGEIKQVILMQKVRYMASSPDLKRRLAVLQEIENLDPSTPVGKAANKFAEFLIKRIQESAASPKKPN